MSGQSFYNTGMPTRSNFEHFYGKSPSQGGFRRGKVQTENATQVPKYNKWLGSMQGSQLLNALREENTILKEEFDTLNQYVSQSQEIFEKLEVDNQELQQLVTQKNSEILKLANLIENINRSEPVVVEEYEKRIQSYENELSAIQERLNNHWRGQEQEESKQLKEELEKAKLYTLEIQNNLQASIEREQALSNVTQYQKLKNEDLEKSNEELRLQLDPLEARDNSQQKEIEQLTNENKRIKEQWHQKESSDQAKIIQLEKQFKQLQSQLDSQQQGTNSRELKQQSLQNEISQLKKDHNDLLKQMNIKKTENDHIQSELKIANQRIQNSLASQQNVGVQLREAQEEIKKLKHNLDINYEQLVTTQRNLDEEINSQGQKHQKNMEILKSKFQKQLKEKDLQVVLFETQLKEARQENENIQEQKLQIEKELANLKGKLADYEQQKRLITDLSGQVRERNNKISDLENLLREYQSQVQHNTSDNSERILFLEDQIRNLELKNDHLQHQLEQSKMMESKESNYQRMMQDYKAKSQSLQTDLTNLKALYDSLKRKYEDVEPTIIELQQKNRLLQNNQQDPKQYLNKINNLTIENDQLRLEIKASEKSRYDTNSTRNTITSAANTSSKKSLRDDHSQQRQFFHDYSTPLIQTPNEQKQNKQPIANALVYDYPTRGGNTKPVIVNYPQPFYK